MVATISRAGSNQWSIKALGYYTKDTWSAPDQERIVRKLMKGDYSEVKILKDGEYDGVRKNNRGGGGSGGNDNAGCCSIF